MRNPQNPATIRTIAKGLGSFSTTAGKAGSSMISREVTYIDVNTSKGLGSPGGPGASATPETFVFGSNGLNSSKQDIVHDMGLHATPEENSGGLQNPSYPLGTIYQQQHQGPYSDAACKLLGGDCGL